jgi:enoyl-CoA hydratase
VLAAEPPTFCSGGALDELLEPVASLEEIYAGMLPLAEAAVPTIAAVGGAAIGAGVNLPLFCDVIVASPAARFDPRWLDVEIHPGGGHLARLAARIGRQGAAALVLCGDTLDGEAAVQAGLAWRCVPDDELLDTSIALASRAARRSRDLVVRTKQSLDASLAADDLGTALEIELAAQRWSMSRPAHHRRVADIKASIDAAQ